MASGEGEPDDGFGTTGRARGDRMQGREQSDLLGDAGSGSTGDSGVPGPGRRVVEVPSIASCTALKPYPQRFANDTTAGSLSLAGHSSRGRLPRS